MHISLSTPALATGGCYLLKVVAKVWHMMKMLLMIVDTCKICTAQIQIVISTSDVRILTVDLLCVVRVFIKSEHLLT